MPSSTPSSSPHRSSLFPSFSKSSHSKSPSKHSKAPSESSNITTSSGTSVSPPSPPPAKKTSQIKGVKKFVKGVKRRLSSFGHAQNGNREEVESPRQTPPAPVRVEPPSPSPESRPKTLPRNRTTSSPLLQPPRIRARTTSSPIFIVASPIIPIPFGSYHSADSVVLRHTPVKGGSVRTDRSSLFSTPYSESQTSTAITTTEEEPAIHEYVSAAHKTDAAVPEEQEVAHEVQPQFEADTVVPHGEDVSERSDGVEVSDAVEGSVAHSQAESESESATTPTAKPLIESEVADSSYVSVALANTIAPLPQAQEIPTLSITSPEPEPVVEADARSPHGEDVSERSESVEVSDVVEGLAVLPEVKEEVPTMTDEEPITPTPLVEPEVPDPFLIDSDISQSDEDQGPIADATAAIAAEEDAGAAAPPNISLSIADVEAEGSEESSESVSPPVEEIALARSTILPPSTPALPTTPSTSVSAPAPAVDMPVPPTPSATSVPVTSLPTVAPATSSDSSEEDEEEPLSLYLPGLTIPTMFLPIPNTDPLTTLLTKYISPDKRPQRDLSGEWQRSGFDTLVMTNSWRALARMARDRIVATDPEDVGLILSLWYLRLSSLARLRLFNQTTAELSNLFTALSPPQLLPPSAHSYLWNKLMPFELEVLKAKTKYWSGDHMGYLDELRELFGRCKRMARKCDRGDVGSGGKEKKRGKGRDEVGVEMWKERGARVCLIMASQLIEMKDFAAATSLLTPLLTSQPSSPYLQSAIARIYLQAGHLSMASHHFGQVAQDANADPQLKAENRSLMACAEGEWEKAEVALRELVKDKDNFVAVNNLAVALLSQGNIQEGIQILEESLRSSPSTVVTAEPILFNLSTLYELRSNTAADKKRDLLIEVAKWAGDGLRATCLKMPSS